MRAVCIFLTLIVSFAGCKKDETPNPDNGAVCGTTNPAENIPWLKNAIASASQPSTYADYYAKRAIFKGREILWIEVCCPACDMMPPTARYCDGSVAGMMGTDIPGNELTGVRELWRSHNGACGR